MRPFRPTRVITVSSLVRERQLPLKLERHDGSEPQPQEIVPLAAELPIRQQMVLLLLRRGELSNRVVQVLRERHTPEPVKSDWAAMIASGHVVRQHYPGGSRLGLTPGGLHSAQDLCRWYVKEFKLHHTELGPAVGNRGPFVRCVYCGWERCMPRSRNAEGILGSYGRQHEAQAKAGTLPAAYAGPAS
jgi:hypothetical protein